MVSTTHIILDVDVIQAFVVQLLLHAGDGSVVAWYAVDARVLQPSLLHQLAAHLHDQRHELQAGGSLGNMRLRLPADRLRKKSSRAWVLPGWTELGGSHPAVPRM